MATMATARQVEYNRRHRRKLREARDRYERLLRRVLRVEAERDSLREIAAQRLALVESQAGIIRSKIAELDRLQEAAAVREMEESGVPTVEAQP